MLMKNSIKIFFLILMGLIISSQAFAEEINNYETNITINTDSTVNIQEKIFYDFGQAEKHGIYRDIPYKYAARGGTFTLIINNVSVTDENGNNYTFSTDKINNNFRIKIGDADKYVSGLKTYIINYTVKKAINYFADHDELYWNAVGGDWEANISKSSVKIHVPENNNTTYDCYYGYLGSTAKCSIQKQGNTISVQHNQVLSPKTYITIVVGIPKGILHQPTIWENIWYKIQDNIILLFPFLVFIFLFIKWYKQGRDPKGRGVIIAQYEPLKDLSPLEAATLINESFEIKNIPAEIIHLAIKGYLKIEKKEKSSFFTKADYLLTKTKENDDSLNIVEKTLLSNIFKEKKEILLSEINSENIIDLDKKTQESLTSKGYFSANPNKVKTPYMITGSLLFIVTIFLYSLVEAMFGIIGIVAALISGGIIIIFGIIMPKKSLKGVEAKEYLLGLKEYIALAEIRRIQFHNAPEKTPQHFEALLPYAMIFGLEKEWAKQFESLTYSPTWYNDKNTNIFVPIVFANDLKSFSSAGISSMTPASSGGSGFSGGGAGGGFGGGGGGSW